MKPPVSQLVEGLGLALKKSYRELGYSIEACNHNKGFAIDDKGNLCKECFGLSWKVELKPKDQEASDKPDQLSLIVSRLEKLEDLSLKIAFKAK